MTVDENKLEILKKVENGTLSIQEGADLIGILERAEKEHGDPQVEPAIPPMEPMKKVEPSGCWRTFWSMFLVLGAILTSFSAFWLYKGYTNKGFGWGFWLSWIPMILGVVLLVFGWALLESPWMHVKLHSRTETKKVDFIFSMPVPFNIARWFFENFGQYMPEKLNRDEALEILNQAENAVKNGEPFQVQVDAEKDGSKVEVFIN
jgi:hypothetical protein